MHIELLDALGANLDALGPSVDHLTSLVADGAAALDMPPELDMPMSELKEKAFELDSLGSEQFGFHDAVSNPALRGYFSGAESFAKKRAFLEYMLAQQRAEEEDEEQQDAVREEYEEHEEQEEEGSA